MALLPFIIRYWKYIAIILAVIGLYLIVSHKLTVMKREAYNKGVTAERSRVIKLIREENARNRQFEEQLQKQFDRFGDKLDQQQRERIVRETIYRDRLVDIVDNDPSQQCLVNPEVTELRNQIRRSFKG